MGGGREKGDIQAQVERDGRRIRHLIVVGEGAHRVILALVNVLADVRWIWTCKMGYSPWRCWAVSRLVRVMMGPEPSIIPLRGITLSASQWLFLRPLARYVSRIILNLSEEIHPSL